MSGIIGGQSVKKYVVPGVAGASGLYAAVAATDLNWDSAQPWTSIASILSSVAPPSGNYGILHTNVGFTVAGYPGYEFMVNAGGEPHIRIIHDVSGDRLGALANVNVCDGNPHVIAVTYDGSKTVAGVKFYIDGALIATETEWDTLTGSCQDATNSWWLLNQVAHETIFYFPGDVYGMAISNIVRDAAYMAAHGTDAAFPGVDASTVARWRFREGTGLVARDSSGHGNDATLSSASLWIAPQPIIPGWHTQFALTGNGDSSETAGYTFVERFEPALFANSGTKVRVTLYGSSTGGDVTVSAPYYIGHAAGSGNTYDFDGTQIPLTVGGSTSFVIPNGSSIVSDDMSYAFNSGKPFLIARYGVPDFPVRRLNPVSNVNLWYKSGSEASISAKSSGYSTANILDSVFKLEVFGG